MTRVNALQTQAIVDFAASAYIQAGAGDAAQTGGASRETLALSMAAGGENPGNLPGKTAHCLDKLADDYAGILKRIDAIRVWAERGDTSGMRLC